VNIILMGHAANLIENLRNSSICDELIKYMAPHFQLSNKYLITNESNETKSKQQPKICCDSETEPPKRAVKKEKLIVKKCEEIDSDSDFVPPKRAVKKEKINCEKMRGNRF
jgi:hypothetical protein